MTDPQHKAATLKCWRSKVTPLPLSGGITNYNFTVEENNEKFVVRIGDDIPVHCILRANELAISIAAFKAGISPEVYHHEPGVLVLRWVEGKTLTPTDIQSDKILVRILETIKRCHHEIPRHLKGVSPLFWVFQVIRDYAGTLHSDKSRMAARLPELIDRSQTLESIVGPTELIFGHNDLLAANFIDTGDKMWLIDWDYGGFNSPLLDLGGLASNNELSRKQENWLLEAYFEKPVTDELYIRYSAMKCASLLREAMWSM
ncbi:MAG: phosphotransferase family protein, partial [Deltaproteobacteria bacterium]|nr:phosphotransferase family protein [Deltaproteobacteria bacterium]